MLAPARRHALLRAMGYTPWQRRAAVAPALPEPPHSAEAVAPMASSSVADPLCRALLQACACEGPDALAALGWECRDSGPAVEFDGPTLRLNLAVLRRDGSAKRLLWKTLRSLRRQRLGSAPR